MICVESILCVYLSIHHRSFHTVRVPVPVTQENYLEEAALELAQDSGDGFPYRYPWGWLPSMGW